MANLVGGASGGNSALYNNYNNQAPANYYLGNSQGRQLPQSTNANNIGGQAAMYAQAAQMGFNAVFGAFTKPAAAKLEAAQIRANADLQKSAQEFNIAQMRKYQNQVIESSLSDFVKQLRNAQSFIGTQKAAMSASGIWSGSTFDAFIEDSVRKTVDDIDKRSGETSEIAANIRLQADMLEIRKDVDYKIANANAQGIQEQGRLAGIMSLFGIG
jgi:hypothetical protein